MLRYLTSGESHGKCLTVIIDGVPSGIRLSRDDIDRDLRRRQLGYGRGKRMQIECDTAEITAGVRAGLTLGSPIAINIQNRDWENWHEIMSIEETTADIEQKKITRPRPGHADLAGGIKYRHKDLRNILERASARETAARVSAGAIAKRILEEFNIYILSFVIQIGSVKSTNVELQFKNRHEFYTFNEELDNSPLRCPDKYAEELMVKAIDNARNEGDSLGGIFQVMVFNVPIGLGSCMHWDRRLDARIAGAVMSIPAIKGVEIGLGFDSSKLRGSQVHDEIFYSGNGFYRDTNNAGGIEGGMSNGETIVIKAGMKPIPTLSQPLRSVDFITKEPFFASKERSDVCAVPAAGIVGEAVVAIEIANAFLEKFGGDSLQELKDNFNAYITYVSEI
ncbi:MAG: chorismate synthase [bacterium]